MRNSQLSRLQITGTSQTNENNTEKKDTCPKLNPNFRDISANHGTQCDRIATSQRRIAQNHSCLCIRDATLLLSPEQTLQLSTSQPTLLLVMVRLPTSIIRRLIILLLPDLSFYPPPNQMLPTTPGKSPPVNGSLGKETLTANHQFAQNAPTPDLHISQPQLAPA